MPMPMVETAIELGEEGHVGIIGLRLVAEGEDWVELAFDYDARFAMSADSGIMASGPIISLIDTASGAAIIARNKKFRPMATLDLRVDYMRAAVPGRSITARATCYRITRNVAFVRCEAHDGDPDDPVASAMASFFFTAD